jgi:hypothetical protein
MSAVAPVLDTGGTYYEITIPGNILWMMTTMTNVTTPNLSSTYKVINNINMTGFTLPNTLESICKTTVAAEGPFLGIFDGQGFTITIRLSDVKTTDYFGLFGFVGNGSTAGKSISNLNVVYTGSTFSYTPSPAPAISYLGSLVGYCNKATINNCNITYSNDVVITSTNTTTSSQQYTGGICGRIENTSVLTNSTITFNGTAKILHGGTVAGTISAIRAVGGICGYMGNIANTVTNTLQFCTMYISKDTTLGSEGTGTAQLASKIGGICGGAAGDVILNNCNVLETSTALGGTLFIQNSGSNTIVGTTECNSAVLIGELRQESLLSSNRQITVCEFSLTNFDISFRISYGLGGAIPSRIGCFIGQVYNSTVQPSISSPITNINNITGSAKNITIYNATNNNSSFSFDIGGMFGRMTGMLNVKDCTLTTMNDYTVNFACIAGSGASVTPLNYGGISSFIFLGAIPTSIIPVLTSEDYRIFQNCNLNIGRNTTITIIQNSNPVNTSPNESNIGGMFGKGNSGTITVSSVPAIYPLIIRGCNATYGGDFTIEYTNTVPSTTNATVNNGVFLGGYMGQTRACNVLNCITTFGSNNNIHTMSITADVTVAYNSYMSVGIGQITNAENGAAIIPSLISGCTVKVNGNVTLVNNNNINPASGVTIARQAWNGGLVGRINNASTCTASTLTITGTYDSSAKSSADSATIGGLAGDIISTAALGPSTLSSCQGTIGGACTLNSNINVARRGLVGGMAGLLAASSTLDTNTITYNGSLTMTSTNSSGGIRFLGGLVGLSFDSGNVSSKIITNNSIIVNGAASISLGSTVDNIAGGLFGRLADGTTCSGCSGTFNTLAITSTGTGAGNKIIAGLCGNVLNSATTATATITLTTITVASTTQVISNVNVAGNTTYTGVLFGYVQDAATNAGTSASICTGTFNGRVTLHSNNSGAGAVYMGGIVAYNLRSQISSMTLNLLNGVEMDNISITNLWCYAGLIAGTSGPATTSNIAEIIDSTVNVTGTALIDTNSTSSASIAGGLGGLIDSRFENNTINGNNCVFTINSSATVDGAWAGGLIGSVTNSALQSYNVINNTLNAGSLNINVSSATASFVAGMIGRVQNTGITQKITVSNNSVLVGNTSSLTNVLTNPTVYVALLFASVDTVTLAPPTVITNNTFLTGNMITITASNASPTIYINDLVAFYNASIPTVSNNAAYICKIDPYTLLNFQSYPSTDANGLTIYSTNYPITSEYIVPAVYKIDILPAITVIITCIIPPPAIPSVPVNCCTANICDKNPQVANYDNEVIVNRKGGQALIANVNEIYASQRTNTARIRVTPVFSSYQQYMTYLQSKNSI